MIILREYVARKRSLPGVPSASETHSWPHPPNLRNASSGSVNNGNDYVMCRKRLLEKYVARWLFALHCQDPGAYAGFMFESITDIVAESLASDVNMLDKDSESKESSLPGLVIFFNIHIQVSTARIDKVLRSIMKLCQSSIAFSVEDDLFLNWLALLPLAASSLDVRESYLPPSF